MTERDRKRKQPEAESREGPGPPARGRDRSPARGSSPPRHRPRRDSPAGYHRNRSPRGDGGGKRPRSPRGSSPRGGGGRDVDTRRSSPGRPRRSSPRPPPRRSSPDRGGRSPRRRPSPRRESPLRPPPPPRHAASPPRADRGAPARPLAPPAAPAAAFTVGKAPPPPAAGPSRGGAPPAAGGRAPPGGGPSGDAARPSGGGRGQPPLPPRAPGAAASAAAPAPAASPPPRVISQRMLTGDLAPPSPPRGSPVRRGVPVRVATCPFLHTINRAVIDFDFHQPCAETLSNKNVYMCLVCGRCLAGQAPSSPAYRHAVGKAHHVFANLTTRAVVCLPDSYEVDDPTIADVVANIAPAFTLAEARGLLAAPLRVLRPVAGGAGAGHVPGFFGVVPVPGQSFITAVVLALAHVEDIARWCLVSAPPPRVPPDGDVVGAFAALVRRLWNPHAWKGFVAPHDFLRAVATSGAAVKPNDPIAFMSWICARLGAPAADALRGTLLLRDAEAPAAPAPPATAAPGMRTSADVPTAGSVGAGGGSSGAAGAPHPAAGAAAAAPVAPREVVKAFQVLPATLPDHPLFKEEKMRLVVPQVTLPALLRRYNGDPVVLQASAVGEQGAGARQVRMLIASLPRYIVVVMRRFGTNRWDATTKNATLVRVPALALGLDMKPYCTPAAAKDAPTTVYDLVANVVHEGHTSGAAYGQAVAIGGVWAVQLQHVPSRTWYHVSEETVTSLAPELVEITEACIMVWQRRDVGAEAAAAASAPGAGPGASPRAGGVAGWGGSAPGGAATAAPVEGMEVDFGGGMTGEVISRIA